VNILSEKTNLLGKQNKKDLDVRSRILRSWDLGFFGSCGSRILYKWAEKLRLSAGSRKQ